MKVIIPTKNRANIISTHDVFKDLEVYVLVHNEQQSRAYRAAGFVGNLIVTNTPADAFGVTRQREWACQKLASPGEWFIFGDDNIISLTCLPPPYYDRDQIDARSAKGATMRALFSSPLNARDFASVIVPDCIAKAETVGAHMVGFATTANPYFRGSKWSTAGFVIGKLMLWHNVPFKWDHTITMEDFRNSAAHLLEFGAVLINRYCAPVARHYQTGGHGPYASRVPYRLADCRKLIAQYPGLLKIKNRPGFVPGTDLQVVLHSPQQIARWRQKMLRQIADEDEY